MSSSTRRLSRIVAVYVGVAFQVLVLGSTGHAAEDAGVHRRGDRA